MEKTWLNIIEKDMTLLPAKTFWETATVLSEYWDDCQARSSCIL